MRVWPLDRPQQPPQHAAWPACAAPPAPSERLAPASCARSAPRCLGRASRRRCYQHAEGRLAVLAVLHRAWRAARRSPAIWRQLALRRRPVAAHAVWTAAGLEGDAGGSRHAQSLPGHCMARANPQTRRRAGTAGQGGMPGLSSQPQRRGQQLLQRGTRRPCCRGHRGRHRCSCHARQPRGAEQRCRSRSPPAAMRASLPPAEAQVSAPHAREDARAGWGAHPPAATTWPLLPPRRGRRRRV